jgi:hypothetical protein
MRNAILAALATASAAFGQSQPAFDAASIQEARPIDLKAEFRVGCSGGPGTPAPKIYTCNNSDLWYPIREAYDLKL